MVGIAIKQGGKVISKEAYAGDISKIKEIMQERAAKDPTLQFEFFDEDHFKDFEDLVVTPVKSKDQNDFSSLITVDDKIMFIAKKLGLQ